MSNDNEAKVVISADAALLAKVFADSVKGFREMESQGKKALKELDTSWTNFQKSASEASKAILKEVAGPMLDPMKQAFARALGDAREWRQESTRIMGATGTDWKTIGGEIDAVSLRTKRMPEDTARYLDSVRSLTGSWKFAKDSAEDYSDVSRMLGKQTLAEMAPLASTMQNIFGVEKIKPFFDQAIAGARQLGQSGEMAARQFERIAPMLTGLIPKTVGQGEKFAKSTAAMLPALQKMGLSPEESEIAMQQIIGSYSGDNLVNLERQLRSAGMLGKGQSLKDNFGRLTKTLPEIMGMESELIRRHARGVGGGRELEIKLAKQNFPPLMAGTMIENEQLQRYVSEAMEAKPAGEIEARAGALAQTPEMQRQAADLAARQRARFTLGAAKLTAQDMGAIFAGKSGNMSMQGGLRDRMYGLGLEYGPYAMAIPGAQTYAAGAYAALGMSSGVSETIKEGKTLIGAGKGLSADVIGGSAPSIQTHGMTLGELFGKIFSKDVQRDQAAATADALGQKVLKVQLVAPASPVPMSGGGEQG